MRRCLRFTPRMPPMIPNKIDPAAFNSKNKDVSIFEKTVPIKNMITVKMTPHIRPISKPFCFTIIEAKKPLAKAPKQKAIAESQSAAASGKPAKVITSAKSSNSKTVTVSPAKTPQSTPFSI